MSRFENNSRKNNEYKWEKKADVSGRPKAWAEALLSPLGKKDQPKLIKNPLTGRIVSRVAETKTTGTPNKRVNGPKAICSPLTGRIDARENARIIEIYISQKRRLEFRTDYPINFPMDYSLGNNAPVTTSHWDHVMDRKMQYAMIKVKRVYSGMSFAIGRETHTIFMRMVSVEPFWRPIERLVSSFQIRRPATQRLVYSGSTDAIVQYRANERMTNITVDFPEMRRVWLLHQFQFQC